MIPIREPSPHTARPKVVVVAQAAPAQGGIPAFVDSIMASPALADAADLTLLNTTREAVRTAGTLTTGNLWHALVDAARTFRAGRSADVVHIQTAPGRTLPTARAVALAAAGRAAGAGVVVHVHSARINGGRPDGFRPGVVHRALLKTLAIADAVLTVSGPGATTIRGIGARVPARAMDNAVDVDAFEVADPLRQPPTLLFLGTLSFRKGLADLAEALTLLRDRGCREWRLEVVGGPNEVGEVEAGEVVGVLEAAGLRDALVGAADRDGVRERLASAQVLVLPSHWEGQPIAILEAMAAGLPIVATRVGAIPDVVRDGVDGLLVDPHDPPALADAIEQLVRDPQRRARMGESARLRARDRYDLPVLAANLAETYRLAARSRSR